MNTSGKGFYINKKFSYNTKVLNSSITEFEFLKETQNCFVQFSPINNILLNNLKQKFNITTFLIRGRIYDQNNLAKNFEKAIHMLLENENPKFFREIEGDYTLAIEHNNILWILNGRCSQYEIFWMYNNSQFIASNYLHLVSKNTQINYDLLPILCYGDEVNIYKDLYVLKRNSLLKIDYTKRTCKIKENIIPNLSIFSNKTTLDEIGEEVHSALLASVKNSLQGSSKSALLLSGGIDSGAVAKCLQECNANTIFYTWSSKNKNVSEYQYSKKIGEFLGYETVELIIDEPPYDNSLPKHICVDYPHTKTVSCWWECAFEQASKNNIDTIFTGHHGAIIGAPSHYIRNQLGSFWCNYGVYNLINNKIPLNITKLPIYKNEKQIHRGIDIFTVDAQKYLKTNILLRSTPAMNTDNYSYLINFSDRFNIPFEDVYLSSRLLDISYSIPAKFKQKKYGGFIINKIPLRYSMIGHLPKEIVSRCHSANLDFMDSQNFKKNLNYYLSMFKEDSVLVKKGIIDISKIRDMQRKPDSLIDKNRTSILISLMVENWLSINEKI